MAVSETSATTAYLDTAGHRWKRWCHGPFVGLDVPAAVCAGGLTLEQAERRTSSGIGLSGAGITPSREAVT